VIETWFGDMGVWYLIGLGATALIFALLFPRGIWGWIEDRTSLRLLPVGYRLRFTSPVEAATPVSGGSETKNEGQGGD
jgi:branched-chain amino acid transport system permease protein